MVDNGRPVFWIISCNWCPVSAATGYRSAFFELHSGGPATTRWDYWGHSQTELDAGAVSFWKLVWYSNRHRCPPSEDSEWVHFWKSAARSCGSHCLNRHLRLSRKDLLLCYLQVIMHLAGIKELSHALSCKKACQVGLNVRLQSAELIQRLLADFDCITVASFWRPRVSDGWTLRSHSGYRRQRWKSGLQDSQKSQLCRSY